MFLVTRRLGEYLTVGI